MASRLPRTLEGQYSDINRRFFDGTLPEEVRIGLVEHLGEGEVADTRAELAAIKKDDDGVWHIELDASLHEFVFVGYLVLAHEMVHLSLAEAGVEDWTDHRTKEWKQAVRRLQGKGFLMRVF